MADFEPPGLHIEPQTPLDNPLAAKLESTLVNAYQRYTVLFSGMDPETLTEPERSGVIFLNILFRTTINGKKPEYHSPMSLIPDQVKTIKQIVESLPAYIPHLFKNYDKNFEDLPSGELDLLTMSVGNSETEDFFERNGTHNLILDCLKLANAKPDLMKQVSIGQNQLNIIDFEKLFGSLYETYQNADSLETAMNYFRSKVRMALRSR